MKRVAYYRWDVASETPPGKRIRTRHMMNAEEALARDPIAKPIGEPVWRDIPETDEERAASMLIGWPTTQKPER